MHSDQETHLFKIHSVRPGRPRGGGPAVRLSAKPRVEFHLTLTVVEAAQRRMPDAAQDLEHRLARLRQKVALRGSRRQRRARAAQLEAPISDSPA